MRIVISAIALCSLLSACATTEPFPNARPLTQSSIDAMGPTKLSVTGSQTGVAKSWYFTQVNGGGAGLIGVVAGAIAMVIINAGPSARAQGQANEIAKAETPELLNVSLVSQIKDEVAHHAADKGVTIPEVVTTQKFVTPGDLDDVLEVTTVYLLSEDSSVLKVMAQASYANKAMPYKTPYSFKSGAPKSEATGPLYRNNFTYYSKPLPAPVLTPELKARLVASIEDSARDAGGALPKAGSSEDKSMQHEIQLANDDKLTPNEISVFLTREWLKDNGALVRQEVANANTFIAKYVLLDVNRTAIPSVAGTDELIETLPDQRTVRRSGAGVAAGSYISSAANVTNFATYGNAVAVAKSTTAYVNDLKDQAKKAK